MSTAVAVTTWLQLAGVAIALLAALASWAAVRQAREGTNEIRQTEREARQPLLLLAPAFSEPAAGPRTMLLSIYNAGDVAIDVGVILIGDDALARQVISFMRPGETVSFGSDVAATGDHRALAFAQSKDGDRWVWNHNRVRRRFPGDPSKLAEWTAILAVFYPGEDFCVFRPAHLLRGDNLPYY